MPNIVSFCLHVHTVPKCAKIKLTIWAFCKVVLDVVNLVQCCVNKLFSRRISIELVSVSLTCNGWSTELCSKVVVKKVKKLREQV